MPPKWKKKDESKASRVISYLDDNVLELTDDGNVSLGWGTDFTAGVATLTEFITLSDEIPDDDLQSIVRQSIIDAKKADDLGPDRVLEEIADRQANYLRRPTRPYVLLTSLAIKYFDDLATVKPYGATITFSKRTPERFDRPDVVERLPKEDRYSTPKQFTTTRVHVYARNETDAAEKALDRLNFIRGLWNFTLTYGDWRFTVGIGHKPISKVMIGPVHTLHKPDGTPVQGIGWYQPNYNPAISAKGIQSKYDRMKKSERQIRNQLSKSSFEEDLRDLMVRYALAVDETDLQSAFLKLWSLLETLTDSYGTETVDRAMMIFKNRGFRKLILHHFRERRNDLVHKGREAKRSERLVYQLKGYVDALLRFLLDNVTEWDGFEDFGLFLSLPKNAAELKKRRRYHDLAYQVVSPD